MALLKSNLGWGTLNYPPASSRCTSCGKQNLPIHPAGGDDRGWGWLKPVPPSFFVASARKTVDAWLAKRVSRALKYFPAAQPYRQSACVPRPVRREVCRLSTSRPSSREEFATCSTSDSVASGCHPSRHDPLDPFYIPSVKHCRATASASVAACARGCPFTSRIHES